MQEQGLNSRNNEDHITERAERIVTGFIVAAATLCVGFVAAYLLMFDARGLF